MNSKEAAMKLRSTTADFVHRRASVRARARVTVILPPLTALRYLPQRPPRIVPCGFLATFTA
jgi:hypothetical protein